MHRAFAYAVPYTQGTPYRIRGNFRVMNARALLKKFGGISSYIWKCRRRKEWLNIWEKARTVNHLWQNSYPPMIPSILFLNFFANSVGRSAWPLYFVFCNTGSAHRQLSCPFLCKAPYCPWALLHIHQLSHKKRCSFSGQRATKTSMIGLKCCCLRATVYCCCLRATI